MIELRNISAGYRNKIVLNNISVTFPKGKLICVIGENGSGKSTLLKTATGILPSKAGEIIIDGQKSTEMSRQSIAQKISYLAQFNRSFDMTVHQLVLHGRFAHLHYPRIYSSEDRAIAASCMERMGVSHLASTPMHELSGGMQQNAYIAMALAGCSDYILLDEPTTYLDVANKFQLMNTLQELSSEGKGVVAVLHDLTLAMQFADEIVVISNGQLLAKQSPENMINSNIINRTFGISIGRNKTENGYVYYLDRTKNKHL